jgi:hypothetical protein
MMLVELRTDEIALVTAIGADGVSVIALLAFLHYSVTAKTAVRIRGVDGSVAVVVGTVVANFGRCLDVLVADDRAVRARGRSRGAHSRLASAA